MCVKLQVDCPVVYEKNTRPICRFEKNVFKISHAVTK